MRSEIIPNTAFSGEKSEDTPFALYQARGVGSPRVNLSQRACPDASHVPHLMLSTMENSKGASNGSWTQGVQTLVREMIRLSSLGEQRGKSMWMKVEDWRREEEGGSNSQRKKCIHQTEMALAMSVKKTA